MVIFPNTFISYHPVLRQKTIATVGPPLLLLSRDHTCDDHFSFVSGGEGKVVSGSKEREEVRFSFTVQKTWNNEVVSWSWLPQRKGFNTG